MTRPFRTFGRARARATAVVALAAVFSTLFVPTVSADAAPDLTARHRSGVAPYRDPSRSVPDRVEDLLSRMTLDEKIGQMTLAERSALDPQSDLATFGIGAVLSGGGSAPADNSPEGWANMYDSFQETALSSRLGIPMIYGADAVHGHNNVIGATIFPHNIGLGATRNPRLMQRIGKTTATEVAGTGIDWNFAPCLCVARNDRWGRTYESFGEVPELPSAMTTVIDGFQGRRLGGSRTSILSTAKHYVGDGGTTGGVDQGDTQISEAELRAVHLPPFEAAVERGVGSIMISFTSWNGQKLLGHEFLINDVLKGEVGFDGFVVSDWEGINQIDGEPGFTGAEVAQAINAGIDMSMVPVDNPLFIELLRGEVEAGTVPMSRLDDANRRILTKKFELGLFERPFTDRRFTPTIGSQPHRDLARQAVRESQVLLKNDDNVLPLARNADKLFVAGKNANDIGNQSGGWTISWQGSSGPITPGTTILEGIRDTVRPGTQVTFDREGEGIDSSFDAAIAVVGEEPYAEFFGDRPGEMGLDEADLVTLSRLEASGVPLIVVLVSGRPLDVAEEIDGWDALVAAWLPGTEGQGVADVLFGKYNPTGKLPVTWMLDADQQPINVGDGQPALFDFGFGLRYSHR